MARRSVSVLLNGEHEVRTFGGCGWEVRAMAAEYRSMTKEEFLAKHPRFEEFCRNQFELSVSYH